MILSEKDGVCILEGMISVSAAVKYKSRKVHLCYIDAEKVKKRDRKVLGFLKLLEQENIPTELCERAVIDAFLEKHEDAGTSHGGIAAVCGERIFTPLLQVCNIVSNNILSDLIHCLNSQLLFTPPLEQSQILRNKTPVVCWV